MLTVRDIAGIPGLRLAVAAGADGLGNEISWLHVSELEDPTQFLEGGEFVLTTGLGVGELASAQRAYVRRLAEHGIVGLAFGVGFGFSDVPPALVEEANRLGLPVLSVPYEVPFVAITKAAFSQLAGEQLDRLTRVLEVNERLAEAVLESRGLPALLAIVCGHLGCSLAVVDDSGRIVAERHPGRRLSFDEALELPVVAGGGELARLKAVRDGTPFGEYDRLVLHHGQTALAFELSRRRAVSAAELRLAGDLLEDLEADRLDDREAGRRMAAFGLDPTKPYAVLLAASTEADDDGRAGESLRRSVGDVLERNAVAYLSTARRDRADFVVEAASEDDALRLADAIVQGAPAARVGVGRPARGRALGRSLVEARAALDSVGSRVASYRDLGSVELLLSLPDATLEAYVHRVLGDAERSPALVDSLAALLECGCRWSEAAERLGVHRHTLRYRMDRFREQTGKHPDDTHERMELWLALKARQALAARG